MELTRQNLLAPMLGNPLRRLLLASVFAAGALATSGCGDEDGTNESEASADSDGSVDVDPDASTGEEPDASTGEEPDGSTGDEPDGAVEPESPVYVLSTSLWTPDGTASSYLAVVESLGAGPAVDLGKALEFGGGARAYGPERGNAVYVTSDEDGTMREVTFMPDRSPRLGRTVSFAALGITTTTGGNVHLFVSPTKAYFVSQDTLEIIVWNPEAMEIVKTIPLDLDTDPATSYVAFYPRPIVVGDSLILISNEHTEDSIGIRAQVSVVDLERDRVVSTEVEDRCHGMVKSAVDANGDRYFASGAASAAVHLLAPETAPAPCMLRIRDGETSFDPTWSRSFTDELGTRLWTGVTPGADGKLYVQAIPEDAPAVLAGIKSGDAFEVADATPWSWYALSDGDAEPVQFDTDLVTPPYLAPIPVDGKQLASVWDTEDTTLIDLASGETPQEGLVVPGFVYNIVRIR